MNRKFHILLLSCLFFVSGLTGQEQNTGLNSQEKEWLNLVTARVDSIFEDYSLSWEEVAEKISLIEQETKSKFGTNALSRAFLLHKIGVTQYVQSNYQEAIDNYLAAVEIRELFANTEGSMLKEDIIRGYNNIGGCYLELKKPYQALSALNAGIEKLFPIQSLDSYILLAKDILIFTARAYTDIGDFDNAIRYYELSLDDYSADISENQLGKYLEKEARANIELGEIFSSQLGAHEKALIHLNKGFDIVANDTRVDNPDLKANAYHNIGLAYEKLGKYSESIKAYENSIAINRTEERLPNLALNHNNLGIAFKKAGKLEDAKSNLLQAQIILKDSLKTQRGLDLIYDNLGDIASQQEDFTQAILHYDAAIAIHINQTLSGGAVLNPSISTSIIPDKYGLLTSLASKAKTLARIGGPENESQALYTYHQLDTLVNLIRQDFQAEASKANLAKRIKPIYEQAIELCYQLYQNNPDQKDYLKQAFTFSEKSRSLILLEAVRGIKAGAQLSEEVYQTMAAIDLQRNYYEKQLQLSQTNPKRDESEVQENREALIRARLRKDSLLAAIEAADPAYFQLKYSNEVADMEMVQQSLEPDQSLLEYFVGRDAIYAFVINQERPAQFIKIAKDFPLQQWVQQLSRETDQKSQNFFSTSHQLYQAIFQILEESLNKKLIIISDDILGHLSFELLYSKNLETNRVYYRDLKDYLLHQYQISYSYSASMALETSNRKNRANRNMLAVAPAFSKNVQVNQVQFSPLQWNQDLAKSSAALFSKNKLLLEQEDNIKDDFLQKAGNYSILQLATHAVANDSLGDLAFILFGGKASDALYAKDLYTTPLQAEMVVLSACQGALGELQTGEGIISLARAFIYAGAKSVIPTLWSVEDETTKDLTLTFYQHIKSGHNKDEALRQAKLDYLDQLPGELDHKAHPYYWGAFVAVGEMDSIKSQKSLLPWVLAFIAIIVLGLLYLSTKRST